MKIKKKLKTTIIAQKRETSKKRRSFLLRNGRGESITTIDYSPIPKGLLN